MSDELEEPSMSLPDEDEANENIEELLRSLAKTGIVRDTGRKKWSNRTQRYWTVWVKNSDRCHCGRDAVECFSQNCPYKREPFVTH